MLDENPGKDPASSEPPEEETLREAVPPVKQAKGERSLFNRTVSGVLHVVGGIIAGFTIAFILVVWRLSEGPISIAFLAPHISSAINNTFPGVEASFGDTLLVWAGWDRAIDVRIIDLQISSGNGDTVGFVPETAFSLSASALLRGQFAASELELFEPTLSITREASGQFEFGFAGDGVDADISPKELLQWLSDKRGGDNPAAYIKKLTVTDADLIIEDNVAGRSWVTPDAHLTVRRIDEGFSLGANFVANLDGSVADFLVSGTIDEATGRLDAGVSFEGVNPSVFSEIGDFAAFLSRIDLTSDGLVTIAGNVDGQLDSIGFDLTGGDGQIALPAPFDATLDTTGMKLVGMFDAVVNRLEIDAFSVSFADGTAIDVPYGIDHSYPLSSVRMSGAYQDGERRLTLEQLVARVGKLDFSVSGLVDNPFGATAVMLDIAVPDIAVAELRSYWPASVGDDAYNWVIPHITDGRVTDFAVAIEGGVDESDGAFEIDNLDGRFQFDDLVMTYLDSMPEVTRGRGNARFDHDQITFDIESARSYDMVAENATVTISGISGANEQAKIRVPISGEFRRAMEMIDREPLGYASALGIDPATVTGSTDVDLGFDFPLLLDLAWEHVTANAHAVVEGVSVPGGLFDLDVQDAAFEIDVDNMGMDIIGDLKLEGYATTINWHQAFDPESTVRNTYTLNVWVDEVESLHDLGIKTGPFSGDLIRGDIPLWVNVVEHQNGEAVLSARADLTGVDVDLSAVEWSKPSGTAGEAHAEVRLRDGNVYEITSFRVKAPELFVEGRAEYDENSLKLSRVELATVDVGRTNLNGLLIPRENGFWDADFSGSSLDLAGVWDDVFESDLMEAGDSLLPSLTLSAQFDRVWLSETEHVDQLTSAFVREDETWRTVFITATLEDNQPLGVKLAPSLDEESSRVLTMWSKDAGAVLRLLRINDNVIGGDFNLRGKFDDTKPDAPLVGTMEIREFRVLNAPTLTKIVSVMSLTGIIEALGGEGLYFSELSIPFSYGDGILEMKSARANGPSLGFTANGRIYTHANVVDVQGTVVPAYMINSLLGNIPLIGGIFSGGEEGGGIFAARYSMTGSRDEPDVSVNPLSALTPGFLRNFFGLFEGGGGGVVEPPPG